jgi:hypothetical protein
MDTQRYEKYMATKEWQRKRKEKLKEANYQCEKCGTAKNLHVHHINYDHLGFESLEELVVLCEKHHDSVHVHDNAKKKKMDTQQKKIFEEVKKVEKKDNRKPRIQTTPKTTIPVKPVKEKPFYSTTKIVVAIAIIVFVTIIVFNPAPINENSNTTENLVENNISTEDYLPVLEPQDYQDNNMHFSYDSISFDYYEIENIQLAYNEVQHIVFLVDSTDISFDGLIILKNVDFEERKDEVDYLVNEYISNRTLPKKYSNSSLLERFDYYNGYYQENNMVYRIFLLKGDKELEVKFNSPHKEYYEPLVQEIIETIEIE